MPFLLLKCSLVSLKKPFCDTLIDFPKIRHKKNILSGCIRRSQNLDFFAVVRFKLFRALFPLLFSRYFNSCYLLRFISFLAVPKSWLLTEDKVWKWDLDQFRSNGLFCDHFCTKTDKVDFQVATSKCHQNPKTTVVQLYHPLIKNVQ